MQSGGQSASDQNQSPSMACMLSPAEGEPACALVGAPLPCFLPSALLSFVCFTHEPHSQPCKIPHMICVIHGLALLLGFISSLSPYKEREQCITILVVYWAFSSCFHKSVNKYFLMRLSKGIFRSLFVHAAPMPPPSLALSWVLG